MIFRSFLLVAVGSIIFFTACQTERSKSSRLEAPIPSLTWLLMLGSRTWIPHYALVHSLRLRVQSLLAAILAGGPHAYVHAHLHHRWLLLHGVRVLVCIVTHVCIRRGIIQLWRM